MHSPDHGFQARHPGVGPGCDDQARWSRSCDDTICRRWVKTSRCGVELSKEPLYHQEVFMAHATHSNAALTPRARLRLARLIVEDDWPPARAAERYDVSWKTAKKWAERYRAEGPGAMSDRSSRPHCQPNRTPAPVVRKIVHLRWKQRLGPVEIGDRLGMPASTVHAVLVRCRINRLTHIDRATGEPIRRYEHEHPGDLITSTSRSSARSPTAAGGATWAVNRARRTAQRPLFGPMERAASTATR